MPAHIGTRSLMKAAIHSVPGFDVSSDGQRFLIPVVTSQEGPTLVVMQNWEAALRKTGRKLSPEMLGGYVATDHGRQVMGGPFNWTMDTTMLKFFA